ncbi:hypothetical protein CsatA_004314 [Cannabis sativa]
MNFEFMVKKSGTDVFYATCRGSDCKWRVRGRKRARCDMFEVTVFHNEHTCSLDSRHADNRQAAPWVVGHLIKNKFKSDGTKYKAKDIQRDMFQEYGIKMSYEKAWRCREKALMYSRGTPAAAYSQLPGYFYVLEQKNPGTITDIITEDNRFKYCFWSLAACRRGFKFCRPVISIDGTFLKTRFGGTMLVAVAYDANNQLFLIAFAIVDSENHDSWKYFLQKLKEAIGEVENLVFVSDRHQSIEHVVEVLRQMDPPIAAYVDNIGLEKWARPYCLGDRYNIMTNNAAESLNNVTEEFRAYPITTLVEFIRFTLQNWFANRLEKETWKNTYDATINLVGEEDEWVLPEHMQNMRIGVPVEKKPVGRPRKSNAGRLRTNRFPSNGQKVKEPRKCSNCGALRHNKATCKARV